MTTSTLTHLQLDEACSVFLVIEPLVILKGGNLLIIEAVWRLATNDNCVALNRKESQPSLSCPASLKQLWSISRSGAQGLQLAKPLKPFSCHEQISTGPFKSAQAR